MSDIKSTAVLQDSLESLGARLDLERRREVETRARTASVELAIHALSGTESTDDAIVKVAKTFADFIIHNESPQLGDADAEREALVEQLASEVFEAEINRKWDGGKGSHGPEHYRRTARKLIDSGWAKS